jgi:pyruvate kinase
MSARDLRKGRRAKIVCTLGPAVDDEARLEALIRHGMDAARLNLNFSSLQEHADRIDRVRRLTEGRRPVAIIADLPGRKLRIGNLEGGSVRVEDDAEVRFVVDAGQSGDAREIPVHRSFFHDNMAVQDPVLLHDGVVELQVRHVARDSVIARVVHGGTISERTGLYSPGIPATAPPITDEDRPLLQMAADQGADYVALGWVTDDQDLLQAREVLDEVAPHLRLVAKIERPEAFARLDGILRRSDAVMVRRGDLGAQLEVTRVPLVQREVLRRANRAGVPAVIATQMLNSMVTSPRPTRAEASDVASAVAAGADGVLLSAETAVGQFPVEAVDMMARVIRQTELEPPPRPSQPGYELRTASFTEATASLATEAADRVCARLIVCFTEHGRTALLVSKYRPGAPILAFCTSETTRRRLSLTWGIRTDRLEPSSTVERMVEQVETRLCERGLVETGDTLILVFGAPMGTSGRTNTIRMHRIGG